MKPKFALATTLLAGIGLVAFSLGGGTDPAAARQSNPRVTFINGTSYPLRTSTYEIKGKG
jgi:hypothetical protein